MPASKSEQKNPDPGHRADAEAARRAGRASRAAGLKQVAQYTGLHPSTAHRILSAMASDRLIDRIEPGSYRLGMRLLELGNLVKMRINVREMALPVMRELHSQIGETVNLSVRHDDEIVYVERTSSGRSAMRVVHVIGARAALHITAAGKLFLLEEGFPKAARVRQAHRPRRAHQEHPHQPAAARARTGAHPAPGLGHRREEAEIGVRCVAAAVRDDAGHLVAALSISSPADRMKPTWGRW
jgi:DNA-binding IclR family transcriptional regulator